MSSNLTSSTGIPQQPARPDKSTKVKVVLRRGPEPRSRVLLPGMPQNHVQELNQKFDQLTDYINQLHGEVEIPAPPQVTPIVNVTPTTATPTPTSTNACVPPELAFIARTPSQTLGAIVDTFGITNVGQDEIVTRGDYIYAYNVNPGAGTYDLRVFEVVDRTLTRLTNPIILLGTVGGITRGGKISNQGRYCYLTAGWSGELHGNNPNIQVVDVIDPNNPTLKSTTVAPVGYTFDSFPLGKFLYVTGGNGSGSGNFYVYDITNPSSLSLQSNTVEAAGELFGLYVRGTYAYVGQSSKLLIYDVSNPAAPVKKSTFTVLCAGVWEDNGYVYCVGGPSDGSSSTFSIVDVSNPTAPKLVGSLVLSIVPFATTIYANCVSVQGDLAVVTGYHCPVTVIDVSTRGAPVILATGGGGGGGSQMQKTSIQGRYVWVANIADGSIQAFLLGGFQCHAMETAGMWIYDETTTDILRARQGEFSGPVNAQAGVFAKGGGVHSSGDVTILDGTLRINGETIDQIIERKVWEILTR